MINFFFCKNEELAMRYFRVWLRRYAESIISMYTIWPILICNQYGPTHIPPSCSHYVSDDVLFVDSYYEINEHETLWYGIWTATNIYIIVVISLYLSEITVIRKFLGRNKIHNCKLHILYVYLRFNLCTSSFYLRYDGRWRFIVAVFKNLVCETCRFTET